jgi:hypothetical protein
MTPQRRAAVITGTLLLAGIIGALAFAAVEQPLLTTTASLARIPANAGRLSAGGLMELATAGASVGIALALYPVLRPHSEGLALGAVTFRTIESVLYAVAAVITLSLPGIARQYAQSAAPGRSGIQALANALAGGREAAILAAVLAYITGGVMYYAVMYRSRLVPRWLTGWGLAAEALMLAAGLAAAFSHTPVTSYSPLIVPVAAQEAVLGAWLILRGFSPRATPER